MASSEKILTPVNSHSPANWPAQIWKSGLSKANRTTQFAKSWDTICSYAPPWSWLCQDILPMKTGTRCGERGQPWVQNAIGTRQTWLLAMPTRLLLWSHRDQMAFNKEKHSHGPSSTWWRVFWDKEINHIFPPESMVQLLTISFYPVLWNRRLWKAKEWDPSIGKTDKTNPPLRFPTSSSSAQDLTTGMRTSSKAFHHLMMSPVRDQQLLLL